MLRVACSVIRRLKVQPRFTYRTLAAMAYPHPVILCGRTETIGAVVIENLKPEFEGRVLCLPTSCASKL